MTYLVTILILLFAAPSWGISPAVLGESQPEPPWTKGALWYCGWETGSDETNATPTTPEESWGSSVGTYDSRITTNQLFGAGGYEISLTTGQEGYVNENIGTNYNAMAFRFRYKLVTNGLTTANDDVDVFQLFNTDGSRVLARVSYKNSAGTYIITFNVQNAACDTLSLQGSITPTTITNEFQIVVLYDVAAPKAGLKLYSAGGVLIGSVEETVEVCNNQQRIFRAGLENGTLTGATAARMDNFYVLNTTSYLSPE